MWSAVAVILIVWLLALLTSVTYGGWVHLLALTAAALAVGKVIRDRRTRL